MDELIKKLKKAQGELTQNEFAEKCGISSSNLSRIYQKKQKPSPELLKKIGSGSGIDGLYEDLMIATGYWRNRNYFEVIPEVFRSRFLELREASGESFEELALRTDVPAAILEAYENGERSPGSLIEAIQLAKAFGVYTDYLTWLGPYKNETEYSEGESSQEVLIANLDRFPEQTGKEIVTALNKLFFTIQPEDEKGDRALRLLIPHFKAALGICDDIHDAYIFCLRSDAEDSRIAELRKADEGSSSSNSDSAIDGMIKRILAHFGQKAIMLLNIRRYADKMISKVEDETYDLLKEYFPTGHEFMGFDDEDS